MNETTPRRMTLEEKLAKLGISDADLNFYFEHFAQNPHRYMIKMNDDSWQLIKSKTGRFVKLDRHVVAYHLLGKYWAATFAPEVSHHLCIDIDASRDFLLVYNTVREWIPRSIVILSSDRKGVHIYAFIRSDFRIRTHKIFSAATMELKIRGIETAPGTCEIFPAQNRFLRLPLGKGSCILDPKILTPMNLNLAESIRFIKGNLCRHSFEELFPGLYKKVGRPNVKF